jgi:hypothetical protein
MNNTKLLTLFILISSLLFFISCDKNSAGPGDNDRRAQLYVTNNSNGDITVIDVTGSTSKTLITPSSAAEGIYYDAGDDEVVQASRSEFMLNAYSGVSETNDGRNVSPSASGSADLESPREIAVSDDTYVVSDNGSNTFFVYNRTSDGFQLRNTFNISFPVWGITFKGDDLYAVVDTENELAVFYDFLSNTSDGGFHPSKRVTIEGIVRTHGLTYNGSDDIMVMTDIGAASNATDDGGFHVISDFSAKFDALSDGDVLSVEQQLRVAGSSTLMGNPIDVAYDSENGAIYISEIGNGGGRVLGFTNYDAGGNVAPSMNMELASASSIYFSSDETDGDVGASTQGFRSELYVTNNSDGNVTTYNLMDNSSRTLGTDSEASEGIYYSAAMNAFIQASRSNSALEYYSGVDEASDGSDLGADFSGGDDLPSPREIAVAGNNVIVSDNDSNQFFVYTFDGSTFTLQNTLDVPYKVWGITFMGDDLLSVVDASSDLAIFNDFLANNTTDGTANPDKRITVQGIIRTHGITFSLADDALVMTDIGLAANASTDGGFHLISDATAKLDAVSDGGMLTLDQQVRVAGPATMMGNPIDVAYNHKTNSVYVSEVGNGKALGFSNIGNGGNLSPDALNEDIEAASSIYFYGN